MDSTKHDEGHVTTTCSSFPSQALILDIGDVLFHWNFRALTAVPPSTFHSVILGPTWSKLECGEISECEALESIGEEL
jgi:hypothetical protein